MISRFYTFIIIFLPFVFSFSFAGNLNVLAFIGGVFFILISVGIFITVMCFASRKRIQRHSMRNSDKRRGK